MRGKISSMLFAALTAVVMSWGSAYAQSFAYNLKVGEAESASLVFGRLAETATDAVDELDFPAPPGAPTRQVVDDLTIPVEGVLNYLYFQGGQGYFSPDTSKKTGDAYYRLSEDYKSAATNASTWVLVIADTVANTVELSWEAVEAVGGAPAEGTFQLLDAAGAIKVADLRTTASDSLAKGIYYIQYLAAGAAAAPATPAPIYDVIAAAAEGYKEVNLGFDADEFIAGDAQVYYYNGNDQVFPPGTRAGVDFIGSDLLYTLPEDISGFDTVVINYTLTRNNAGDDAPSATGAVELRLGEIIEINLAVITVGGEEVAIDGAPVKVKVDYVDDDKSAYKPITLEYDLDGVADALTDEANRYVFTGPAWKGAEADYPWEITFKVGSGAREPVDFDVEFIDEGGAVTPTYTADILSEEDQIVTVTLQPGLKAKGGTVSFAIIALEGGVETADVFTATPAVTFQLKGDGNLDVDNSDDGKKVEYPDIVYIFRYRFLNGKTNPLNLLLGTPDQGNLQKATEIRDRIMDMEELLDVDMSDNGAKFEYPDIIYIFRYCFLNGSTNALNLLLGTPEAGNQELANAIQQRIKDLLLD
jgi:hypothetical protein